MSFSDDSSSKALVKEGSLDAVKIGSGDTYLGAFAVALGASAGQLGAITAIPPLVGAIAQVLGMRLAEMVPSRRSMALFLMRLQGLLWLPIALLPLLFNVGTGVVWLLLGLAILYHISIGLLTPLWTSLVGDVVPATSRGEFFGHRNRWIAISNFSAILIAGQIIHQTKRYDAALWGFVTIFLVAGAARMLSARSFSQVSDPALDVPHESKFTFWQFIGRARHSNFVKFVVFVSGMNFAASISGPYFVMYMLRDVQLTYAEYTCVVAASLLAQFIVLRSWGRLSDQFGNRKILNVCGWLISANGFLWLFCHKFYLIIALQLYAGVCWSGFTLAAANFVFDAVTPAKRARCIAYQSIINASLVFFGASIGGYLVEHIPQTFPEHLAVVVPYSRFLSLFFISSLCRVAVMTFLYPTFREVRQVERIRSHELLVRVTSMKPLFGATFSLYQTFSGKRRR